MANCSRTLYLRNVFAFIAGDKRKRAFTTSIRNETAAVPPQNSIQTIKMTYAAYESVNPSDLSSNIPIIVMHGLLGSKTNWHSLSKAIHTRTKRKVIAVDARNHGESPHTSTMSYPLMAEDVHQFMTDLSIPKATVVGHSMGGRTMMYFALKYPELVEQLVVVDISPVRDSPNISATPLYLRAMHQLHLGPSQSLSAARRQADRRLTQLVQGKELRQFFLANLIETTEGDFKWRINIESLMANFHELASFPPVEGRFDGPTYFIGGGASDYITHEDHEPIRSKYFPSAAFEYIPGAGHWLHAEKPAQFLDIFCRFIDEGK